MCATNVLEPDTPKFVGYDILRYPQGFAIPNFYQTLSSQPGVDHVEVLDAVFDLMVDLGVLADDPGAVTATGEPGFGPGSHWQAAIVECDETFLELDSHGVHGAIERRVIDPGGFTATVMCPECLQPRAFDEQWRARAADWIDRADTTALSCDHCNTATAVESWAYDPPLGFADLWVTFWNWPSINREFINRVQDVVGHHVSLIEGKGDAISTLVDPGPTRATIPPAPR